MAGSFLIQFLLERFLSGCLIKCFEYLYGVINCKRLLNQNKYKRATASKTYSFPKSHVSYRKPRTVSTEQRERARQMMIVRNKSKEDKANFNGIVCVFVLE